MNVKEKLISFCSPLGWLIVRMRNLIELYAAIETNKRFKRKAHLTGSANLQMPVFLTGMKNMYIGDGFSSKSGARLECIEKYGNQNFEPLLKIGDNVSLNYYCHIGCIGKIVIGDNVLIGSRVLITDHSHGRFDIDSKDVPFVERPLYYKGAIIIEDNVWLCENSCILGGVTIGRGTIVAANAVVTSDIPPYSLVAGIPAKIVKRLDVK